MGRGLIRVALHTGDVSKKGKDTTQGCVLSFCFCLYVDSLSSDPGNPPQTAVAFPDPSSSGHAITFFAGIFLYCRSDLQILHHTPLQPVVDLRQFLLRAAEENRDLLQRIAAAERTCQPFFILRQPLHIIPQADIRAKICVLRTKNAQQRDLALCGKRLIY